MLAEWSHWELARQPPGRSHQSAPPAPPSSNWPVTCVLAGMTAMAISWVAAAIVPCAHRMPIEIGEHIARPFQRDKLILVEIQCLGLQGQTMLHRLGHLGGEGAFGGLPPAVRTVFELRASAP